MRVVQRRRSDQILTRAIRQRCPASELLAAHHFRKDKLLTFPSSDTARYTHGNNKPYPSHSISYLDHQAYSHTLAMLRG